MNQSKPVVYFVFRKNTGAKSVKFAGFTNKLISADVLPDADYRNVALEDLLFVCDKNGEASVCGQDGAKLFDDASFVYFKSWEGMPERAGALAVYLQAKGIPFEDHAILNMGISKLPQMYRLWATGLRYIPTISSVILPDEEVVLDLIGKGPYVLKPIHGEKGDDNYLCKTYREVRNKLESYPKAWMLQAFIQNEGDYRIWVYGYEVRGGIYRHSVKGSHLNNTSKGAESEYRGLDNLSEEIISSAKKAALATGNAVAGVDIMPSNDSVLYVLEVNQGSQIVSGHETSKKMQEFGNFIKERIYSTYKRQKQPNRLKILGRYTHVNLPEFKIKDIFAKIDTGAYQSAIHAKDIQEVEENGQKVLRFTMLEGHGKTLGKSAECTAHDYDVVKVKSSTGAEEMRYRIRTKN